MTKWISDLPKEKQGLALELIRLLTQIGANEAGYDPNNMVKEEFTTASGEISRFLFLRRVKQTTDIWQDGWSELQWAPSETKLLRRWKEIGVPIEDIQQFAKIVATCTATSILAAIDYGTDPDTCYSETNQPIGSWGLSDDEGNELKDLQYGLW